MEENDGVPVLEEVLGRGGPARARREVVDEPHRLVLQRHDCTAGGDQNYATVRAMVVVEEGLEGGGDVREVFRGRMRFEVEVAFVFAFGRG